MDLTNLLVKCKQDDWEVDPTSGFSLTAGRVKDKGEVFEIFYVISTNRNRQIVSKIPVYKAYLPNARLRFCRVKILMMYLSIT